MVTGISEEGLSINCKVKVMNFPASEKILQKLDDIIKEKPDDLMGHSGINNITNNINLSNNVKKIFNKIFKESSSTSIEFSSAINHKDKTQTVTDTNARL